MPTVQADGVQLSFEIHGTGEPTILLIHGATGDAASYWSEIVTRLVDEFTIITYDQRGFGRSFVNVDRFDINELARDAALLLEHVELGPVTAVGISLGGLVAQQLAVDRPDLVARVVIAASAPWISPRLQLMSRVLQSATATRDPALLFDLNLLLAHGEAFLAARADEIAASRKRFVADTRPWYGTALTEPAEWQGVSPGTITCPTLLIYGDEDAEMPLRYARELQERIPGARITVLAGTGHKCAEEQPDSFADAIRSFHTRPNPS
jgi:pimeloyl-ACP methyl ester carboxylesterase